MAAPQSTAQEGLDNHLAHQASHNEGHVMTKGRCDQFEPNTSDQILNVPQRWDPMCSLSHSNTPCTLSAAISTSLLASTTRPAAVTTIKVLVMIIPVAVMLCWFISPSHYLRIL
jgi:hypothetical protein